MSEQLIIPRGIGISKRVFIAMAVILSLVAILFLYFLNHYSHHHMKTNAQSQRAPIAAETEVTQTISTLETNKYKPASSVVKNVQMKPSENPPSNQQATLAGDSFKTAGDSSLSVYHSADVAQANSSDMPVSSDLPPPESSASSGQPDQYAAQNAQDQKIAFLKSSSQNQDVINSQLQLPPSKYEIMAGAIIPATLVTGISSDLPGTIAAKVSRDIFDTATGNYLLIPQGTTIVGAYDSKVTYGQSRVLIAWQRLIFPNGNSYDLNGMPGADLMGLAGLSDSVDHHYARIFGSALLMSAFGAAGQLSQPQSNNQMSSAQLIYGAIGQEMSQTSARLIAKNMDIQPTIQIRAGANFNVLLTRDMVLPTLYHFS